MRFVLAVFAFAFSALAFAADGESPVGTWKSYDDKSGEPKSIIEITETGGMLEGRILKLFRKPGEDPDPVCDKCTDARKDQKIVGMTILTGLRHDGDEWKGGQILDPKNGKVYSAKLSLIEDGRKLNVRGFLGFSLLGRTQVWERQAAGSVE